jgi:hypothetical protein
MPIVECKQKNECCQSHDMAFIISFVDYKSGLLPMTGHSAVLLINGGTGKYCAYDFAKADDGLMGRVRRFPRLGYNTLVFNRDCLPGRQVLMNVLDAICAALGEDEYRDISDSIVGLCGCGSDFSAADELGQRKFDHYKSAKNPTASEPEYAVFGYNCATFAVEIAATLWDIPVSLHFYPPQYIHYQSFHVLTKPFSYISIIRGTARVLHCPCASST